ncbi:MAG: hypothetical protein V3V06_00645 [Dehalococcoidia bacterium]
MAAPETDDAVEQIVDEQADEALDDEIDGEVEDILSLLFNGRVADVMPPEEVGEFHDFIREEALRRRRFAVSFRLDCGCLAWIGYALSNVVTHEEGIEFKARATQSFIPDHEADVEHPEGPTEEPPADFADWPIWPFEIYQDEIEGAEESIDAHLGELADELRLDEAKDLLQLKSVAAQEDPLSMDDQDK